MMDTETVRLIREYAGQQIIKKNAVRGATDNEEIITWNTGGIVALDDLLRWFDYKETAEATLLTLILVPPMKLANASDDAIGEYLRDMIFVKQHPDDFGCYSTMEVIPEAEPLSWNEKEEIWRSLFRDDFQAIDENRHGWSEKDLEESAESLEWEIRERVDGGGYRSSMNGIQILTLWHWDGDGHLVFILKDKDGNSIAVENTDCKKSYGWRRINAE